MLESLFRNTKKLGVVVDDEDRIVAYRKAVVVAFYKQYKWLTGNGHHKTVGKFDSAVKQALSDVDENLGNKSYMDELESIYLEIMADNTYQEGESK